MRTESVRPWRVIQLDEVLLSRPADQVPVPPFWRQAPAVAEYFPEASMPARTVEFAVPVKLIVLCDWVSRRVKLLPLRMPDISAMVPQAVPLPVKVTCPETSLLLLLTCFRVPKA